MFFSKAEIQGKTYLKLPIQPEELIEYQVAMLSGHAELFIPVIYEDQLLFEVTGLMPIALHLKNAGVNYESLKAMIVEMVDYLSLCQDHLLDPTKLVIEGQHVFYDHIHQSIKILYIPCRNYARDHLQRQMKKLVLEIIYTVFNMGTISKDSKLKRLIEQLQTDDYDLIAYKGQLTSKVSPVVKKKKFFDKYFQKKERVDAPTVQLQEKVHQLIQGRRCVEINKSPFIIGRSERLCDFALPEAMSVGRVHAEIHQVAEKFFLKDLESKNGCTINGQPLEKGETRALNTEDLLTLGEVEIIFK